MFNKIKRNILLNPGPVTTTDTVKQAMVVPDICHREQEFTELLKAIRHDVLRVVNGGDDHSTVLFTASGSGAIEAAISSIIGPNEKIAIVNNGAYGQRMIDIAKRYQIPVVEISSLPDQALSIETIESHLRADDEIRYLALVHHETTTGLLNPLREVGELCHRLQRTFIVDAMSSFAGCEIDLAEDHIDVILSSSNKCLHGMPGMSFVIASKKLISQSKGRARSYYFDLYKQYQALETTGQMPFTPAVQVAYAFKQALDEYFAEGANNRIERYKKNFITLINGLKALGFETIIPAASQSHFLVTVKFPQDGAQYDFDELHDYLYERGFTIYPRKLAIADTFRLACIGHLGVSDIDNFLSNLRGYVQAKQQQCVVN